MRVLFFITFALSPLMFAAVRAAQPSVRHAHPGHSLHFLSLPSNLYFLCLACFALICAFSGVQRTRSWQDVLPPTLFKLLEEDAQAVTTYPSFSIKSNSVQCGQPFYFLFADMSILCPLLRTTSTTYPHLICFPSTRVFFSLGSSSESFRSLCSCFADTGPFSSLKVPGPEQLWSLLWFIYAPFRG